MSLESELLNDLAALLAEHGVTARWQNTTLIVLASRVDTDAQIDIGGFVESPALSVRVPRAAFTGSLPEAGQRMTVDGDEFRIVKVGRHQRSPLLTLTLAAVDE